MAERMKGYNILIEPEKCASCLVCQMRCSLLYFGEFNPSKAFIAVEWPHDGVGNDVHFTEGCTYCGVCARNCAYGALSITGRRRVPQGEGS
ncbi:MAG TPA: hypothetical protein VJO15_08625 [Dehalococcoidia bacterium]|nr:hypothetical protein [Dehalococcoidia bacterium]